MPTSQTVSGNLVIFYSRSVKLAKKKVDWNAVFSGISRVICWWIYLSTWRENDFLCNFRIHAGTRIHDGGSRNNGCAEISKEFYFNSNSIFLTRWCPRHKRRLTSLQNQLEETLCILRPKMAPNPSILWQFWKKINTSQDRPLQRAKL